MTRLSKFIFGVFQTEKQGGKGEKGRGRLPIFPPAPARTSYTAPCSPAVFLCFCAFVVISLVLAQGETSTTLDAKVFEIAGELRCPVCVAESVGDSNSSVAVNMRNIIQDQLEQGKSEREILAFFQERYGDWILLNPPKRGVHLLVWLLPVVVAVIAVALLAMYFKRWTKQAKAPIEATPEDLERVREEMKWQG